MTSFYTLIALLKTFAYFFCPLIVFFRGIWPIIVIEGSGLSALIGYVFGTVWFLLTYIAPLNPQFLKIYSVQFGYKILRYPNIFIDSFKYYFVNLKSCIFSAQLIIFFHKKTSMPAIPNFNFIS